LGVRTYRSVQRVSGTGRSWLILQFGRPFVAWNLVEVCPIDSLGTSIYGSDAPYRTQIAAIWLKTNRRRSAESNSPRAVHIDETPVSTR
jgi:hypothetical protein